MPQKIAAFCFSQRAPILDANVRRVLTRLRGFDADLAVAKNERALWGLAESLLPLDQLSVNMPRYTQGMMDLGAAICVPRNPQCLICPLVGSCVAQKSGEPEKYPVKTRKLSRRSEAWWLLVVQRHDGAVWFETRPPKGIWAGLQCVPVFSDRDALWALASSLSSADQIREADAFLHVLTHRDLHLHPVVVQGQADSSFMGDGRWLVKDQWSNAGLPAPIRKMLDALV